jgi:hypothetical protein
MITAPLGHSPTEASVVVVSSAMAAVVLVSSFETVVVGAPVVSLLPASPQAPSTRDRAIAQQTSLAMKRDRSIDMIGTSSSMGPPADTTLPTFVYILVVLYTKDYV